MTFLRKYANVPMSFADACLVRMSEIMADPLILTTDSDFHVCTEQQRAPAPSLGDHESYRGAPRPAHRRQVSGFSSSLINTPPTTERACMLRCLPSIVE